MKYLVGVLAVLMMCLPAFAEDTEEYKCDLLIKGYDFTNDGLSEAIIKNDKEAIELFVKADLNINLADSEGYSAMDRAIRTNNEETVALIAQAGGEIKKTNSSSSQKNEKEQILEKPQVAIPQPTKTTTQQTKEDPTVKINKFCTLVNSNNVAEVNEYAKTSPDIDKISGEGLAPIHYAVFNDNIEMVRVLIENGADVNVISNDGMTPLDITVLNNQKEMTQVLLEEGAELTENVASELKKFGCPIIYDDTRNLYIAKYNDLQTTMNKIQTKINETKK